ncbi:MAG: ATP-binding cassette domain-containing protein [Myxococcota bacterium]|nr:ATP-binding cassette domain-containing protein [Myxococcota bacterium]
MPVITLKNASLSFGVEPILDDAQLVIEANQRVCLVGRNGAGKSTLLKVFAGLQPLESGRVDIDENVRVSYLPQDVPTDIEGTVMDVVSAGLGDVGRLLAEYERVSERLASEQSETLMETLQNLQERLDRSNGWDAQQRLEALISRHGLDGQAKFESLSGGLKRRVLLAQALAARPGVLLLDEPTNHLDVQAIEWLEEMLNGFPGAIVFVTHDRMFLTKVAQTIVDLDRGRLRVYPGDLQKYTELKAADLAAEAKAWSEFDKKLSAEEAWIRQGIKARRTRNEGRVRALKQLRLDRRDRRERMGKAKIKLEAAERSGRIVAEVEEMTFGYDQTPIIQGLSTTILRGDRIGIIGPNGCGKTTLLKLLLGHLEPDSGRVKLGTKREIVFFDQLRGQLNLERSVQDNLADGHDTIVVQGKPRHVLGYLKDFLFSPLRARSPVGVLSGGERNRLLLAKLFTKPANILILDEPTNDLDTETLELLEVVLLDFPGTVLVVSHDRAFLNHVVTSTLAFDADGIVRAYAGGYDDWLSQRPSLVSRPNPKSNGAEDDSTQTRKPGKKKLSYKEKEELARLPTQIEALENTLDEVRTRLSDPDVYKSAPADVPELNAQMTRLEAEISTLYERWDTLEAMATTTS